ncbi:hypothetical protein OSB04_006690 [Centaurea solstitialis]|uniref:Uncharacterized protein n=1 Tax=Centaurea solstitialis TaxID=347529 RepID=A0AA38WQF3_9ASTR|nr:hypothetical protein OSB04_006690 [Centaurea solstitialis]
MPPRQFTQVADTSSQHSSRSRQEPSNAIMSSHINLHEYENIASQVLPTKEPMTQTIDGVALKDDCYRVSIDESVKLASFLPIQPGEHKTVGDFCGLTKRLVIPDKVEDPTSGEDATLEEIPLNMIPSLSQRSENALDFFEHEDTSEDLLHVESESLFAIPQNSVFASTSSKATNPFCLS